jgi:hypothetical protein
VSTASRMSLHRCLASSASASAPCRFGGLTDGLIVHALLALASFVSIQSTDESSLLLFYLQVGFHYMPVPRFVESFTLRNSGC